MQIKTKIVSSRTGDSKPVKQEVNSTAILPPLVFPALTSAKGQKLHFFSEQQMLFYKKYENILNPLCAKLLLVFYLTLALTLYYNLYVSCNDIGTE